MTTGPQTAIDLVDAAAALLDDHGPVAVTMRAVGGRAGLSAMAAYRHYPNRDALLTAVADRIITDLAVRLDTIDTDGDLAELTHATLDIFIDLAVARPHSYAVAFTAPRTGARNLMTQADESPSLSRVIDVIRRGIDGGQYRIDDPGEAALGLAALLHGLFIARYAGRITLSDNEFRALCHRSIERSIDGLRP